MIPLMIFGISQNTFIAIIGAVAAICGAPLFTYLVQRAKSDTDLALDDRQAIRQERQRIEDERKAEIAQLREERRKQDEEIRVLRNNQDETKRVVERLEGLVETLQRQDAEKTEKIAHLEIQVDQLETRNNALQRENLDLYQELRGRGTRRD